MKKLLMIATGGTIASVQKEHGLVPGITSTELIEYLPSLKHIADVDSLQLLSLDSSNMRPSHWMQIAGAIEKNYDAYDGFVICHGTDTMAFTAAALSYLIQNSKKPIVITGAQKPISSEISDAKQNLLCAFSYAASAGACNVSVVFGGKVIAGTRAKKTHTKSYHAFSSMNYPDIAVFQGDRLVRYIDQKTGKTPQFYHDLNEKVGLYKVLPNSDPELLYYLLERNDAVIIESFGTGGLPEQGEEMLIRLKEYTDRGKLIVMTTQVPSEGSDMSVYRVGGRLKDACGIIECFDMSLESILAKLMWVLAVEKTRAKRIKRFYKPVNFDISFSE